MINQSRNSSCEKYGNGYFKRNIQSTYVTFGNEIFLSESLESEAIEKDDIFIAFDNGKNHDGHDYVHHAIQTGNE